MKGKLLSLLLFLVPAAAGLPDLSHAVEVRNRLVAIVNSDIVTLYELNERLKMMTGKDPEELRRRNHDEFLKARRQVLDMLVEEKLAKQKVEELGISVDAKEVDAAIERIKETNSVTQDELEAALKRDGMTFEQYREQLRGQIERMKLINAEVQSKIIIRDDAIRAYYEKHREEFVVDAEVHLASIFIVGAVEIPGQRRALLARAESIVERLEAGEDFARLAREYSKGPGAKDGGDLGLFKPAQLNEALRAALRDMSRGDVSDPIPIATGYQILKVVDKKEGRAKSLEDARDAIFEILYQAEMEKRYTAWMKDLREKSYTKIIF